MCHHMMHEDISFEDHWSRGVKPHYRITNLLNLANVCSWHVHVEYTQRSFDFYVGMAIFGFTFLNFGQLARECTRV